MQFDEDDLNRAFVNRTVSLPRAIAEGIVFVALVVFFVVACIVM